MFLTLISLFNINIALMLKNLLKQRLYELFPTLTVFAREDTSNELNISMKCMNIPNVYILYFMFLTSISLFNMNIALMLKNLLKLRHYELFPTLTVFAREDTSNELSISMKCMNIPNVYILYFMFLISISLFNMNIALMLKNLLKLRMYELFLTLTVFV